MLKILVTLLTSSATIFFENGLVENISFYSEFLNEFFISICTSTYIHGTRTNNVLFLYLRFYEKQLLNRAACVKIACSTIHQFFPQL